MQSSKSSVPEEENFSDLTSTVAGQSQCGLPTYSKNETNTAEPPPPYTASGQGFGQYSMQSQHVGQPNYGYWSSNIPQQGPQFSQHTSTNNIIVTQVGGNAGPVYQRAPYDYSTQAWIACLFCFFPTGLVAILKANESRDAFARGDVAGAHAAAKSARMMIRISCVIGILAFVVVVITVLLATVT